VEQDTDVVAIDALGEFWGCCAEIWASRAVVEELVERDFCAALIFIVEFVGSNPNPIDFAGDAVGASLCANASDTDNGIEGGVAN
jgi:hypothetical protein